MNITKRYVFPAVLVLSSLSAFAIQKNLTNDQFTAPWFDVIAGNLAAEAPSPEPSQLRRTTLSLLDGIMDNPDLITTENLRTFINNACESALASLHYSETPGLKVIKLYGSGTIVSEDGWTYGIDLDRGYLQDSEQPIITEENISRIADECDALLLTGTAPADNSVVEIFTSRHKPVITPADANPAVCQILGIKAIPVVCRENTANIYYLQSPGGHRIGYVGEMPDNDINAADLPSLDILLCKVSGTPAANTYPDRTAAVKRKHTVAIGENNLCLPVQSRSTFADACNSGAIALAWGETFALSPFSGVGEVRAETQNAPCRYFDLNGHTFDSEPSQPGCYLEAKSGKYRKILIR